MVYTTSLLSVTRRVTLLGECLNECLFQSPLNKPLRITLNDTEFKKLITADEFPESAEQPIAVEKVGETSIACILSTPEEAKERMLSLIETCPCCGKPTPTGDCEDNRCVGRMKDNYEKVVSRLLLLHPNNYQHLVLGSNYSVSDLLAFKTPWQLELAKSGSDKAHSKDQLKSREVQRLTNSQIEKVKAMSFTSLLVLLCDVLNLEELFMMNFFDTVMSTNDLLQVIEEAYIEGIDGEENAELNKLHQYLHSPMADWINEIDIFYR